MTFGDTKYESLEKTLKAGNIFTARNMAIAAIKDMNYIR